MHYAYLGTLDNRFHLRYLLKEDILPPSLLGAEWTIELASFHLALLNLLTQLIILLIVYF